MKRSPRRPVLCLVSTLARAAARFSALAWPIAVVVAGLVAGVPGCGDDDDKGSGYKQSCARTCAQQHQCLSSVNVETCSESCESRLASVGDHLRPDYVAGIDDCIEALSCDQLALATLTESCATKSRASLAASRTALQLCDAVSASLSQCGAAASAASGCIDNVKVFSDRSLRSALTCADAPCDQRADCLLEALGLQILGN